MKKITKFKLENIDQQIVRLQLPARILSVVEQDDDIVLNYVADDGEGIPKVSIDILIMGTGDLVVNIDNYTFLGTVKLIDGKEIWHVFFRYIEDIEGHVDVKNPSEKLEIKSPGEISIVCS